MGVVHFKEITNRDGQKDMATNSRYTRVFQAVTDEPTDGAKAVRDYIDSPNYGDQWEQIGPDGVTVVDSDPDSRCVEKRATQNDPENLQNWLLFCEYVGREDPTAEPPRVYWSGEKYQETTRRDNNGDPVVNSAGSPYRSGMTRDRTRRVLVIEKNVLTYDPLGEDELIDTINNFPFLATRYPPGFDAGLCKLESIDVEEVFYPNYPVNLDVWYRRKTVKVVIDRRGWNAEYLDAGFEVLATVDGVEKRVKIVLPGGGTPTDEQPLDGAGQLLAVGAAEVYNEFVKHDSADWSILNLDY